MQMTEKQRQRLKELGERLEALREVREEYRSRLAPEIQAEYERARAELEEAVARRRGHPGVFPGEKVMPAGFRVREVVKAALMKEAEERGESLVITADRYLSKAIERTAGKKVAKTQRAAMKKGGKSKP